MHVRIPEFLRQATPGAQHAVPLHFPLIPEAKTIKRLLKNKKLPAFVLFAFSQN